MDQALDASPPESLPARPDAVKRVRLQTDPVGTPHSAVVCTWCQRPLVVAEFQGLRCWACPADWARQVRYAVASSAPDARGRRVRRGLHVPLPSQVTFYEATARHVLWGGQAGPGKSLGARWWLYSRSLTVPGHEALLLRENWDQLKANHTIRMAHEVPALGGQWYEGDRLAVFGSGSTQSIIYCGHMADPEALQRYIGIEYGAIVCDEASLYPVMADGMTPLAELSTRARKVYDTVRSADGTLSPEQVMPRFLPVTNPGGPSASFLRDMFIDHTPDFERYPHLRDAYDPTEWVYIPAALDENPYLDVEYARTLATLSATRYEQLRHGDWHVSSGQFFPEWRESVHVARARFDEA